MTIKTQLLAVLEKRMKDFLESRGVLEQRPIALAMLNGVQQDVQRIIIQRLVMLELRSSEHSSDAHNMVSCGTCMQVYGQLQGKYQNAAYDFMRMNRDLFAEIELSH
jgi:hypothetical protein